MNKYIEMLEKAIKEMNKERELLDKDTSNYRQTEKINTFESVSTQLSTLQLELEFGITSINKEL